MQPAENKAVGKTHDFFLKATASLGHELNEQGVKPNKEKTEQPSKKKAERKWKVNQKKTLPKKNKIKSTICEYVKYSLPDTKVTLSMDTVR